MRRVAISVLIVLTVITGMYFFTSTNHEKPVSVPVQQGKIKVLATFYPLYYFAAQIGGDKAEVISLIPAGVEPHDWEPSPQDIAQVEKADLFIYNGGGFEPWAEKLAASLQPGKPLVVNCTKDLELLPESDNHYNRADHDKGAADQKHTLAVDPHVWLDPVLAQEQVKKIALALMSADPANAAYYREKEASLIAKLQQLDNDFSILASSDTKDFVTTHRAFTYLAKRYGLHQIAVAGINPGIEPSPKALAEVVKVMQEKNIKYIFFETLTNPKVAETVARETAAQVMVLNPLEGLSQTEIDQGKDYLTVMYDNLANLKQALEVEQ